MRILVMGGTRFVGRHLAAAALARGHAVTLFHRGRTGVELFPEATHLLGDRDGDLRALASGRWDATVDVSAYVPRQVHSLADTLADRGGRYVYISSLSVYATPQPPRFTEDAPLIELADPTVEEVTDETYGGLKVLCERAAVGRFGAGDDGAGLDVQELGAHRDEFRECLGVSAAVGLDFAPVLVRDLGQRESGHVQLIAVDKIEQEVDRATEAIDLDLHHLAHYSDAKRFWPGTAQSRRPFIPCAAGLIGHANIIRAKEMRKWEMGKEAVRSPPRLVSVSGNHGPPCGVDLARGVLWKTIPSSPPRNEATPPPSMSSCVATRKPLSDRPS